MAEIKTITQAEAQRLLRSAPKLTYWSQQEDIKRANSMPPNVLVDGPLGRVYSQGLMGYSAQVGPRGAQRAVGRRRCPAEAQVLLADAIKRYLAGRTA